MYILKNKCDINETAFTMSLLLCLPVWSHAYRRWCERTQPRQVKTPAPPRSCDEEPSRKWPRGGSWCSSGRCPGKRLFCEGHAHFIRTVQYQYVQFKYSVFCTYAAIAHVQFKDSSNSLLWTTKGKHIPMLYWNMENTPRF